MAAEDVAPEALREATLTGVRWIGITQAIAEVAAVVTGVLLARLILPVQFGYLAVAVIACELALTFASETIGVPLVQRRSIEREHYQAASFLGAFGGGLLTLVVLFVLPLVTEPVFGSPTTELFQMFAPAFLIAGLMIVPLAKLQRQLSFRVIGAVEVTGILISCASSVALAYAGMGAKSYVIGRLLGMVVMIVGYTACSSMTLPRWRPRQMRELLRFGGPASLAGIAGVGYRNVDYLLLGARLPAVVVGFYYRAFTIGVEYERKLSGVVSRIAFPIYARAQGEEHMRTMRRRIVRVNVTATYPMLVLFVAVAPTAVPWLFGEHWIPAVVPAQILAIAGMASTVRSGTSPVVLAAGRAGALAIFAVCETVFYGLSVWIAAPYGLTVVCVVVSATQLISVALAYVLLMRPAAGVGLGQLLRDVGPALTACVPLLAVALLVQDAVQGSVAILVQLAVVAICGGAAYLITLRMLFEPAWADIALLVKRVLPTLRKTHPKPIPSAPPA
jgi:O-antigen/teichoic acid export membrane protein